MDKNKNSLVFFYLIPTLLVTNYFTGVIAFYYLAAALIVAMAIISVLLLAGLLFLSTRPDIIRKADYSDVTMPKDTKLAVLHKAMTICIIAYLLWSGHFVVGIIDIVGTATLIYMMSVIKKIHAQWRRTQWQEVVSEVTVGAEGPPSK